MTDTALTGTFGDEDDEVEVNVDDLLGASPPAVKFPEIGNNVEGYIVQIDRGIQREPSGTIKTWETGRPRQQVILTLETSLQETDDDDGQRRLFVKGSMMKTMREAMRVAKVRGPRIGGYVTVAYTSDAKSASKGLNPQKLFEVTYTPPKN